MKRFLQKSLFRLHSLLLLLVMSVVGVSAAWADDVMVTFQYLNFVHSDNETIDGVSVVLSGFSDSMGESAGYYTESGGTISIVSDTEIKSIQFTNDTYSYGSYLERFMTITNGSLTSGAGTNTATITPTAGATEVTISYTNHTNIRYLYVTVAPEEVPTENIQYTVNINSEIPAGGSVSVDGQNFTQSGTYSVMKNLKLSDLTVVVPANYYVEKSYDKTNKTFDITFKHYYYYNIVVTGSEDYNAYVRYNNYNYKNGDRIESETQIDDSEFFINDVNGCDENISVTGSGFEYTVTATYTESAEVPYYVVFVGDGCDVPSGASATVNEVVYTENSTFNSKYVLEWNSITNVEQPDGYFAEYDYDEETRTFTITYKEYLYYSIVVEGTTEVTAGVVYNYNTYGVDDRIKVKNELAANDVQAASVAWYEGVVSLSGKTFTVSYTKLDYLSVDFTKIQSVDAGGITVSTTASNSSNTYGSGLNIYDGRTITVASEKAIKKIVFDGLAGYNWGNSHTLNVESGGGSWLNGNNSESPATWVAGADAHNVVFTNALGSDMWVHDIKIYVATPIDYTIDLVNAVAGCSVLVNDDAEQGTFTADGTYTTLDELTLSNIVANCPGTHYAEKAYNAETHTFTITFKPCLAYTISVVGTDDANAGVVFNNDPYDTDGTIYSKDELTTADVTAVNVDGYDGVVSIAEQVITVTYTPVDYIGFRNIVTNQGNNTTYTDTKSGVTISGKSFNNKLNIYGGGGNLTVSVATGLIEKIELRDANKDLITGNGKLISSQGTYSDGTWTGQATSVVIGGKDGNDDFYVYNIYVYLQAADPINYTVTLNNAPAGANVSISGHELTSSGSFTDYQEFDEDDVEVTCPDTHFYDLTYTADNHTFVVDFGSYHVYTVAAQKGGEPFADGGIVYDNTECKTEIKAKSELTTNDVAPIVVDGYDAEITLSDHAFTVTYTAWPTIATSNADSEGNYWSTFSFHHPVSFDGDVTPYIVTGVENNQLTLTETSTALGNKSNLFDFSAGNVADLEKRTVDLVYLYNHLVDISGVPNSINEVKKEGGSVESGYFSGVSTLTISSEKNIVKIIVTPSKAAGRNGANCSLNSATPVDVKDNPYTFDNVNATTCTLAFTANSEGAPAIAKIDIVTRENVKAVFPANTGILLKTTSASDVSYTVRDVADVNTTAAVAGNKLVASGNGFTMTEADPDYLYYMLSLNAASDAGSLAFYWGTNSAEGHKISMPANKAYLKLPVSAGSSNRMLISGGYDETLTAIDGVVEVSDDAPIFTLQGKRVSRENLSAGVYVKNGRKFIVK